MDIGVTGLCMLQISMPFKINSFTVYFAINIESQDRSDFTFNFQNAYLLYSDYHSHCFQGCKHKSQNFLKISLERALNSYSFIQYKIS